MMLAWKRSLLLFMVFAYGPFAPTWCSFGGEHFASHDAFRGDKHSKVLTQQALLLRAMLVEVMSFTLFMALTEAVITFVLDGTWIGVSMFAIQGACLGGEHFAYFVVVGVACIFALYGA